MMYKRYDIISYSFFLSSFYINHKNMRHERAPVKYSGKKCAESATS